MIEVEVEDEAWTRAVPDAEAVVVRAAEAALTFPSPPPPPGGRECSVTVLLTDDGTVRTLNAQHRGQDKATNVLSFPAPQTARPHLGDICLAYGVCAREAGEQGKPLAAHLTHLTAHGVLHLLGYDHESEAEAEDMEGLERAILAGLGLPDPYETDAH